MVLDEFVNKAIVRQIGAVLLDAQLLPEAKRGEMLATALRSRLPVPGRCIDEILAAPGVVEATTRLMARGAEFIQPERLLAYQMEIGNALIETKLR
jgi:hypothetical protein